MHWETKRSYMVTCAKVKIQPMYEHSRVSLYFYLKQKLKTFVSIVQESLFLILEFKELSLGNKGMISEKTFLCVYGSLFDHI